MSDQDEKSEAAQSDLVESAEPANPLSPAAQRALEEAANRRAQGDSQDEPAQKEIDGRGGLDPARYGDWEVKGIISDF